MKLEVFRAYWELNPKIFKIKKFESEGGGKVNASLLDTTQADVTKLKPA